LHSTQFFLDTLHFFLIFQILLVTDFQKKLIYPTEADLLNVALFGMTAKEWKEKNPNLKGNQRVV